MNEIVNIRKPMKILFVILFWAFIIFIYLYTVFFRPTYLVHNARWTLFWSYPVIWNGSHFQLKEVFCNLLMLIPVGLLWPLSRQRGKLEEYVVRKCSKTTVGQMRIDELYLAIESTLIGFLCSFGIESLQLLLKRGLFEWDDMMHNTIGSMFGFSLYLFIVRVATKEKTKVLDIVWAIPFLVNCIVLLICKIHLG